MPRPQIPHPIPQSLRDELMVELTSRPMSSATPDQRYAVRRIAADAYASGFADGRATQQSFESIERELAAAPEKPSDEQVHVWQTVRLVGAGSKQPVDADADVTGIPGTVVVTCACGLSTTLGFEAGGLILPLCPDSPEQRAFDMESKIARVYG